MNASRSITPSDLKQPTDYKPRFEREQHLRQNLERRVEALEQERDALKLRLQESRAEIERLTALACPPKAAQAHLRSRP
jgi:predicted RNase H-like nuclease (RuvC/YqgF family)